MGCSVFQTTGARLSIMRFALGMDNREIARAMGRSDGATKVLIHRAIKQLEQMVGSSDSGAPDE